MLEFWLDLVLLWTELRKGLTDPEHVLFQAENEQRYFARCTGCGRVFFHYWACVTAADREAGRQIGCPCGGTEMRLTNLPVWQQVYFLFSRFIVRRLIKRERYWDPRMRVVRHV